MGRVFGSLGCSRAAKGDAAFPLHRHAGHDEEHAKHPQVGGILTPWGSANTPNTPMQADVELSCLGDGERVTCLGWSATGALLLGTSLGRLLGERRQLGRAGTLRGCWGEISKG